VYRFSLLGPGPYTQSISSNGFQKFTQKTTVTVGQTTLVNIRMEITRSATTIEVSGPGETLQSENANVSTPS
jgi:hypothetical protein